MQKIMLSVLVLLGVLFAKEDPFTGKIMQLKQQVDPVYQIPLEKYPKWQCEAELKNGKMAKFISVKSMMQVYTHQDYFLRHQFLAAPIKTLYVQDFLSGEKVPAKNAVYVFGSRLSGPHGDDLIPFASESNAKLFMLKNGGTKILPFARLSKGLIRYLDM